MPRDGQIHSDGAFAERRLYGGWSIATWIAEAIVMALFWPAFFLGASFLILTLE